MPDPHSDLQPAWPGLSMKNISVFAFNSAQRGFTSQSRGLSNDLVLMTILSQKTSMKNKAGSEPRSASRP
jgi:hypothetical protein